MGPATSIWDGETSASLRDRLGVPRLELFAQVESTQDIAHRLAEQGAPAGTVVLADEQTAGRGRMGRGWTSRPGRGIWCTTLERPDDPRAIDVLSIRVGLQLAESLDPFTGEPIRLKWPNDLLVSDRKLGGVLVEARWSGQALSWVAIGVGINVVTPDIEGATGLAPGTRRADVLSAVVSAARAAGAARGWLSREEQVRYASRDALAGRRIVAPGRGQVGGIAPSGSLLVETEQGVEEYRAGTIQFEEEL